MGWAKLLERVFDLDMERCPNCGSELKIMATLLELPVIENTLAHRAFQARAQPHAPAGGQAR